MKISHFCLLFISSIGVSWCRMTARHQTDLLTESDSWPPPPSGPVLPSAAMSAKAISEQTGKEFLYKYICTSATVQNRFRYASVTPETDWDRLTQQHPWLLTEVSLLHQDSGRPTSGVSHLRSLALICLGCRSSLLTSQYWNDEANYCLSVNSKQSTFAGTVSLHPAMWHCSLTHSLDFFRISFWLNWFLHTVWVILKG